MTSSNEKDQKTMTQTVSLMMVIMLAGKILGVLRDRMQALRFGTDTPEGIAFMQASSLPRNFLDIMFASVFTACFIPVFNACLETKGKDEAFKLGSLFLSVILTFTAAFTLLCILFASPLYTVFLDGSAVSAETRVLGIDLLRIMLPLMILSGLAFSMTGILQSLGEFNIPAAMSVVSNGVIILYYVFLFDRFGVYGLCVAFLLGWASQLLIQIPFLIKNRFPFRFHLNFRDPGLRQIAVLALPVMAASWVGPVNLLVNAKAAVNLYDGKFGYNAIHFAYNLYTIISGVYVLSVANVLLPRLSRLANADNKDGFGETLTDSLRNALFLLLPMSFGLMAVSEPLVRLVYQGGSFQDFSVQTTAQALFFFSVGIVGYGLQILLSRACFALQDGRSALGATAAAIVVNFVLSFLLVNPLEVGGPALASSIGISISAFILWRILRKKGFIRQDRAFWMDILKMGLIALVMFGAVVLAREGIFRFFASKEMDSLLTRIVGICLPAGVGVLVYFGGCRLLKVPEAEYAFGLLKKMLRRGRG